MGNVVITKIIKSHICPICGTDINNIYERGPGFVIDKRKFCANCGLPLRIGNPSVKEVKYCLECNALNPIDANYCRCCGKDIRMDGKVYGKERDHMWKDLGLSVLWSVETLMGHHYFQWMNSKPWFYDNHDPLEEIDYKKGNPYTEYKGDGKDVATVYWGGKWRTPTKEEFEELISKCTWEKIIITDTDRHALKVTGPNGNHIIIETTGYAGCTRDEYSECAESMHSRCQFWTSTEAEPSKSGIKRAYSFLYSGYKNFRRTLTLKEMSRQPSVTDFLSGLIINGKRVLETPLPKPTVTNYDDREEREENRKKDIEKRHKLWLEEPITTIHVWPTEQIKGLAIRPVFDKE